MLRTLLTIISLIVLAGCKNKLAVNDLPPVQHNLPEFSRTLVTNMSNRKLEISKTFILNETSEIKTFTEADSSFWTQELAILRKIDLNSPQLNGTFEVEEGVKDPFSNLLIDKYSFAAGTDNGIKQLFIYYLDNPKDIRQINAELSSKNFIAKSSSKFNIWLNRYGNDLLIDSLKIVWQDKTLMQPVRNYQSITIIHR